MDIPPLFHYMWCDKNDKKAKIYPAKYNDNVVNMQKINPNYTFHIWSYDEVIRLMTQDPFLIQYIDFVPTITPWISVCDFLRMCVVYALGGIYSDLDFIPIKNFKLLLDGKSDYFVYEAIESTGFSRSVFNGFFASYPKNPFIKGWIETMKENIIALYNTRHNAFTVLASTGPRGLRRYKDIKWPNKRIYSPCGVLLYTGDIGGKSIGGKTIDCLNTEDDLYAYTAWSNGTKWHEEYTIGTTFLAKLSTHFFLFLGIIILYVLNYKLDR